MFQKYIQLKQINVQQSVLNADAKSAFHNFTTFNSLTGFDICWVTSHQASGLQKSTSPPHISVAQVPYQCLSSPISNWRWLSIA